MLYNQMHFIINRFYLCLRVSFVNRLLSNILVLFPHYICLHAIIRIACYVFTTLMVGISALCLFVYTLVLLLVIFIYTRVVYK